MERLVDLHVHLDGSLSLETVRSLPQDKELRFKTMTYLLKNFRFQKIAVI